MTPSQQWPMTVMNGTIRGLQPAHSQYKILFVTHTKIRTTKIISQKHKHTQTHTSMAPLRSTCMMCGWLVLAACECGGELAIEL